MVTQYAARLVSEKVNMGIGSIYIIFGVYISIAPYLEIVWCTLIHSFYTLLSTVLISYLVIYLPYPRTLPPNHLLPLKHPTPVHNLQWSQISVYASVIGNWGWSSIGSWVLLGDGCGSLGEREKEQRSIVKYRLVYYAQ